MLDFDVFREQSYAVKLLRANTTWEALSTHIFTPPPQLNMARIETNGACYFVRPTRWMGGTRVYELMPYIKEELSVEILATSPPLGLFKFCPKPSKRAKKRGFRDFDFGNTPLPYFVTHQYLPGGRC